MSVETVAADQWLFGALSGDASLSALVGGRVYGHVAPQGAQMPFVLFQQQAAGADVRGVGPARIMANLLYVVRIVAESSSFGGSVQTAAGRIDAVLQAASGTVLAGTVLACVRERPFAMTETDEDGRQYRHLGGIYRMFVQGSG